MRTLFFLNNAAFTLTEALTDEAFTGDPVPVMADRSTPWPSMPEIDDGMFTLATITHKDMPGKYEIVNLLGYFDMPDDTRVLLVERAREGTQGQAWPVGAVMECRVTQGMLEQLGVPTAVLSLQAGPVQSLQAVRFAPARAVLALPAASLQPVRLGVPGVGAQAGMASLRPVRMGTPRLVCHLPAAGMQPVRLGQPGLQLAGMTLAVASLQPVVLGTPAVGGVTLRARALCPVRLGQPTLQRESTC